MRKAIIVTALALTVSGCFTVRSTFQRWAGVYEYDGVTYRVAVVEADTLSGLTVLEYHLVPGATTTYRNSDMIARCEAYNDNTQRLNNVTSCEQPFARAIDALVGPPMMEGGDY